MFEQVIHFELLEEGFEFDTRQFFCPECISGHPDKHASAYGPKPAGYHNRDAVKTHLRNQHGWNDPELADALNIRQLQDALLQWRGAADRAIRDAAVSLKLVRGVDDFLAECDLG